MSNQHNEKEFEEIILEVEELDNLCELEEEIQTISKSYGLHEDDDREEILFYIAENLFEHGRITI
tara:strand:- start:259 stop:453 length:195 start_codon:yes stop_codon:yes gene_type:complete